ncbi:hypothetical protein CH378_19915 [Leptospira kmetyi]|uniref:Uncharacterized protein n=1 Tax=Leptospira kmetyi TaxID=408139 RepID=A0ABX4N9C4_9LEPT|nr:hypothetical protein CH378_19915 [Leptospira kmetyi]
MSALDAAAYCERLLIGEEKKYVYLQLGMPTRVTNQTECFNGGAMAIREISVEFNHDRLVKKNCRSKE